MKLKWILMVGAVTSAVLLAACGEKAKVSSTEPGKAEASRSDSPGTEPKAGPVMNGNVLSGVTAETAVAKMFDGNVKVLNEGEYVSSRYVTPISILFISLLVGDLLVKDLCHS